MVQKIVRVWDLPTRLFHWLLVVCMVTAFVTGFVGGNAMVWHGRIGVAILGLLSFRLIWGFVGPTYSRFATFVRGPRTIAAYLKGQWQDLGHNPLGALSVLGLLFFSYFQVITGLFSNDDIAFNGMWVPWITKTQSDFFTSLHHLNLWVLGGVVALHIAAVLFYSVFMKKNLVGPMIHGDVSVQAGEGIPQRTQTGGGVLAFLFAASVSVVVMGLASGAFLTPPAAAPVPTTTETPSW